MNYVEKNEEYDNDLSHRLLTALTADSDGLFHVMNDPSPEIALSALKNPLLAENHLAVMLARGDLSERIFKKIVKSRLFTESHLLKVVLVRNPKTPSHLAVTFLPHLYLFELASLCAMPSTSSDLRIAAERTILQRLPGTPLGDKLTLARRGTPVVIEALLKEGDPHLMEACLGNPRMKEGAVFQFLNGPNGTPEAISTIARHPNWKGRPNIRQALLRNKATPIEWYALFLPGMSSSDIRGLLASRRLTPAQKKAAEEELRRRNSHE